MWLSCRFYPSMHSFFFSHWLNLQARSCANWKKSIANQKFWLFYKRKSVCFLFDNNTMTERERERTKKSCVWELVNHGDFFHSNHKLNLFPLSAWELLLLLLSLTLSLSVFWIEIKSLKSFSRHCRCVSIVCG